MKVQVKFLGGDGRSLFPLASVPNRGVGTRMTLNRHWSRVYLRPGGVVRTTTLPRTCRRSRILLEMVTHTLNYMHMLISLVMGCWQPVREGGR